MEYVDGKTLYTLQLEAIIQRMMQKVEKTTTFTKEEFINEHLESLKRQQADEATKEIKAACKKIENNLEQAVKDYQAVKSLSQREQAIQRAKDRYSQEMENTKKNIKAKYSLKGTDFKETKAEYVSKLAQQYEDFKKEFKEYRSTLLRKQIDFVDDSQSYLHYKTIRDTYLRIMDDCKPILKASPRNIPNVDNWGMSKQGQSNATTDFLKFMQDENFPIFTHEEKKKISSRISQTLDIFHNNHFYHRDLGQNPRNLMFKKENGELIPYIIDF